MTTHEKIDFAILETLRVHPDYMPTMHLVLLDNITSKRGINTLNFTSSNNARSYISEVTQTDLLQFVLEEAIKCYNAISYYIATNKDLNAIKNEQERMQQVYVMFPGYAKLQRAIYRIADNNTNVKAFYEINTKELADMITGVVDTRYKLHSSWRTYIDKIGRTKTSINKNSVDLLSKVKSDISKTNVARNVQVNHKTMNRCFADVMSGAQLENQHNNYGLDGNLYAAQDIGTRRKNQEDSVLILTHPENNNFKLLVVSDGMGGVDLGEKASQYMVQQLGLWFNALPVSLYDNPIQVQDLLKNKIAQISGEIYDKWNSDSDNIKSGCTVAAAIVTKQSTITATVGDSRIYAVNKGQLKLLTKDESLVWPHHKTQYDITPEELNDLRFHVDNNQILRCIGYHMNPSSIQSLVLDNSLYDKILLLSDGVTDLLSQEEIAIISNGFPPHQIAEQLVRYAITHPAIRPQGPDEEHSASVSAGKDNASAAMFARR